MLHLLLNDHELDLNEIEQSLDGLLRLLAFLNVLIIATVGNHTHQVVDHHLILYGLIVIANLQEVVGDLLVDIDLLLEIGAHFQDLRLVVDGLLKVLETLEVGDHKLQGLDLHVDVNISSCEDFQHIR